MIRTDWYKQAMKDASIPLSKHELKILDEITRAGKFNEKIYRLKVETETPVYMTKNQLAIMKMLSYVYSGITEVGRKNGAKPRAGEIPRKKSGY